MKKLLIALVTLLVLSGCGAKTDDAQSLTISATAAPHAEILEFVKPILEEKGYEVKIEVLDKYEVFNQALDAGDVDANFFQHVPYFDNEVATKGYDITILNYVHIEPFGFYSKRYETIDEIPDGALVVISNSIADHGRVLAILEKAGLITMKEGVSVLDATIEDIESNPKNLQFEEVQPEFLTATYENDSADLVAINGNYALGAGLNPVEQAVILEQADSTNPYVNIVACRTDDVASQKIVDLKEVMDSEEVKDFIRTTYSDGSVIPAE